MKQKSIKKLIHSFTLIEILVVIVVVGILSSFLIISTNKILRDGRDSKRKAEITRIRNVLWSESSMGVKGYPVTPDQGSGSRATCCLGTSDTNCAAVEAILGSAIPKDPSFTSGNKEWCYNYKSNGTYFDLYAKLEEKGSISLSETTINPASSSQDCGTGWINTGLGFCVMQYEAKDVGGIATSQASGTPWVSISQINAIAACKAIGAHLINNAEWMAIARDAESVSSNWNSTVMYRGHTDNSPANALSVSNPADPYDQTGNTSPSEQRRTLTLSNGQTIWDFAGNVWEWVDYTISGANSQPQTPSQIGSYNWHEIGGSSDNVTNWGSILGYDNVGPASRSLNGSNGIGRIYYQSDQTGLRALVRGGYWNIGSYAGAFTLRLNYSPTDSPYTYIGFRCAR